MTEEAFASILDAARAGAEWAWSRIYHEFSGPVRGYLRARGAAEPDDLVGEVFVQIARNIGTFEGDQASFRSWVFTVAHHRLIDERRYRSRRPATPTSDVADHAEGDVELEALDELATEKVRETLDDLSPDQRDVLLLRLIGDLTIEQVASALNKRPGAIKALQRRGLAALRRRIESGGVPL